MMGAIRRAMYTEQRAAYYALNYQWIDAMLRSSAKVHVSVVDRDKLAFYRPVPRDCFSESESRAFRENVKFPTTAVSILRTHAFTEVASGSCKIFMLKAT